MLKPKVLCFGLLLTTALLLTGCGKDEPAPKPEPLPKATEQLRSTVGALAPADSAVLIRFASVSRLNEMVGSISDSTNADMPPDVAAMFFGRTGVDGSGVDPNRPAVLAVSVDKEGPAPVMTWVLPFEDAPAAAAAHKGGSRVEGKYAALSTSPEIGVGGSGLADGLLAGDLSMRVDLKGLVSTFRDEIDEGLKSFEEGFRQGFEQAYAGPADGADMSTALLDAIRAWMESVETADCVVNYGETGRLDLDLAMAVAAGSALDEGDAPATDLIRLAAHLQDDFPIVAFFRFDMKGYMDLFGSIFDGMAAQMPEEKRAAFRAYLDRSMATMDHLDGGWAVGFDLADDGLRGVMVAGAKDGQAYIADYLKLLESSELMDMGMVWASSGERTVSGTEVHSARLTMDFGKYLAFAGTELPPGVSREEFDNVMKQMFGPEGMLVEMAASDGVVYMTMGSDAGIMDRALKGGDVRPHLSTALARVPGSCEFLFYLDFRGFNKALWGLMDRVGEKGYEYTSPDGPPLPLVVAGAMEGRTHRIGLTVELQQVAEYFRSVEKTRTPR